MADAERCLYCNEIIPEGIQVCPSCYSKLVGTCKECSHFIGMGDFALCCKVKYDLCYEDTPVCKNYKRRNTDIDQK